jgi:hypothetical protein
MKINTELLFNETTMGGTTKVISTPLALDGLYTYSVQYTVTGATPAGSLVIFGSNDLVNYALGNYPVNWATIGTATTITTAGTFIINQDGVGWRWFKAEYTPASGTGTLSVIFVGKGP